MTQKKLKSAKDYGYVISEGPGQLCLFQKGPLSQWWLGERTGEDHSFAPKGHPFRDEGEQRFNCTEQWMMAAKAVLMNDMEAADKIIAEPSPKKQKELGRTIQNFNPVVWDEHKRRVVYYGNLWKFSQNPTLKDFLLSFPRGTIFAEASLDQIWGTGIDITSDNKFDESVWTGQNLLGRAITLVRDTLLFEGT